MHDVRPSRLVPVDDNACKSLSFKGLLARKVKRTHTAQCPILSPLRASL
jgi:hypothetical protein